MGNGFYKPQNDQQKTQRNYQHNAGLLEMIETIMIVFAIGVFAIFAIAMVFAAIIYFWVNHD